MVFRYGYKGRESSQRNVQKQIYWQDNKKMASSKTKSTAHTRVLYSDKDTQAQTGRPADHLRLRRPKSYIKDMTEFINFIENKRFPQQTLHAPNNGWNKPLREHSSRRRNPGSMQSMYSKYYQNNQPVPTEFLREMLRLNFKKNSFKFTNKSYLQL